MANLASVWGTPIKVRAIDFLLTERVNLRLREPGKTYHTSDIAGGTNLFNSSEVGSTRYVPHVISFTRLACFSRVRSKAGSYTEVKDGRYTYLTSRKPFVAETSKAGELLKFE